MASPPARVAAASRAFWAMFWLRNRTDPSHMTTLHPPVCMLWRAAARGDPHADVAIVMVGPLHGHLALIPLPVWKVMLVAYPTTQAGFPPCPFPTFALFAWSTHSTSPSMNVLLVPSVIPTRVCLLLGPNGPPLSPV